VEKNGGGRTAKTFSWVPDLRKVTTTAKKLTWARMQDASTRPPRAKREYENGMLKRGTRQRSHQQHDAEERSAPAMMNAWHELQQLGTDTDESATSGRRVCSNAEGDSSRQTRSVRPVAQTQNAGVRLRSVLSEVGIGVDLENHSFVCMQA
jgi:hypothetical protein